MQVDIKKFNVRVYGFLIKNQEVLIAEEIHDGEKIVKFPGGGLKFGEGTFDGLKREFREELDIDIQINDLVYVNNFFQNSYFYVVFVRLTFVLVLMDHHINSFKPFFSLRYFMLNGVLSKLPSVRKRI